MLFEKRKKKIKVHIVGAGEIGRTLTAQLSQDDCEVTVVDTDAQVVNALSNSLDVYCYRGNGASYAALEEVQAGDSDIFISVTDSDELNILACLTAHMMGAKHTVARVRNIDYAKHVNFYRDRLGLSMTINPELAAATEISRVLRFPSATRVEVMAKGRVEVVEMTLSSHSPLCGRAVHEFGQTLGIDLLICAVVRGDQVHIPKGPFVLEAGDVLYLTGAASAFRKAFSKLGMPVRASHSVMVAGAGRITYYLAEQLKREGVHVTVVEESHEKAVEFCRSNAECAVMNDNVIAYFDSMSGSDIENTDAFVSLTANDEFNVVASMYAASLKIPKVISRISSGSKLKILQRDDRITTVSQEDTAVNLILAYARSLMNAEGQDAVESLCRLMDGKIEVTEFRITETSPHINQPIREWRIKADALLGSIIRDGRPITPRGDDVIRPGDRLLVVTTRKQLVQLEDIFLSPREV